jgi:hypothetical protein
MKLSSHRWPVLLLMAVLVGGTILLTVFFPAPRYHVPFANIDYGPLPTYVAPHFLSEVQQTHGLPSLLDTRKPQLLADLHDAFRRHPWVAEVKQVRIVAPGRIKVELRFREPVAVVTGEKKWPVDGEGTLLPPIPDNLAAGLLSLEGISTAPTLTPGQVWPVVQPAARVAAAVRQDTDTLRLAAVILSNDPLQPGVLLRTRQGSVILWQDQQATENMSAEKLRLLREYVFQYGSLDAPEGPYRFDARSPRQGLLRQQILR